MAADGGFSWRRTSCALARVGAAVVSTVLHHDLLIIDGISALLRSSVHTLSTQLMFTRSKQRRPDVSFLLSVAPSSLVGAAV